MTTLLSMRRNCEWVEDGLRWKETWRSEAISAEELNRLLSKYPRPRKMKGEEKVTLALAEPKPSASDSQATREDET